MHAACTRLSNVLSFSSMLDLLRTAKFDHGWIAENIGREYIAIRRQNQSGPSIREVESLLELDWL